ncbi:hypothetical protein BV394_11790 [Brevirhabdus pacifica]|uniref:Uncharacterized protein n=1 Tax=Brevirhabdus pacifica TaxID=1267768 RepID=A0A1U7DJZ6_9RHOB|nr:ABC transporter substrate-binding protein [Brevirhabdus pacifica]APX90324.1 hypothetical protein BV394_11790 [Brevirhabdus pacifica]OWU78636.1 hypothetical protein ATO5_07665 [Loktanella sp. 22II-4b]PJJ80776.1 ABC-type nitrate/sulfonate/bicarbonate transport system substrate-binding protein [Brevirhabdus pacifica]
MKFKLGGLILAGAISLLALPAPAEVLSVASTRKVIIDNLPFFVADHIKSFEKQGLEIELTHFQGGSEVVRAVTGGAASIAMVATSAAIIANGRGEKVRLISSWTAPGYGIVYIVPTDSEIKEVKDFAGKSVGISRPGSVSHTGLLPALKAAGVEDSVTVVPVGSPGDSWAAVRNGRVAASWHSAPYVLDLVDSGEARIIFDISEYLKEYAQGSLVANEAFIQENPETVRKFLVAVREAAEFIGSNPEEAAKIGSEAMGVPLEQIQRIISEAPKDFFKVGPIPTANFEGSLAEAVSTGALKTPPTIEDVSDFSLLD